MVNYDTNELDKNGLAVPGSILFMISWAALFAYFFSSGVQNAIGSTYVSLDGTSDSQTCSSVPVTLGGSFRADYMGLWNTQQMYSSSSAIYVLLTVTLKIK